MKSIPLKIEKVEIANFFPQLNQAEIKVNFTDESEDFVRKTINLKNAESYAEKLYKDIKNKVRQKFEKKCVSDDILGSHVVINFKQDSDEILGKLSRFLKSLQDKAVTSSLDKESYYDLQTKAMRMKMKF